MLRTIANLATGKPTLCVYDVTTRCNSRCGMCGIWKRKEKEMGLAEIMKVFSDLRRFGIHTVFVQGGEPLLRKDILEIVGIIDSMGFHQVLLSNGILCDDKFLGRLEALNSSGRISVTISLDTLDRKNYEKIRGVDRLGQVMRNLRALSRHGSLRGGIHATVTSINHKELGDLMDLSRKLGLDFSFNSYNDNINYASSSNSELSLGNGKSLEEVISSVEHAMEESPRMHRPFIMNNIRYMRGQYVGPCDAFRDSLRITSEGKLSPCLELPPVLDLVDADINEEWDRTKGKLKGRIKACYTKTPCFYGCTRGMGSVRRSPAALLAAAGQGILGRWTHSFIKQHGRP